MTLQEEVAQYLKMTWELSEAEQAELAGYIARGESRLDGYAGGACDYAAEGLPKSLLFDYCRYARSQALEMFEKNFQQDILSLRLNTLAAAQDSAEEDGNADQSSDAV